MDSPQLEDGYTRIANEILEELAKTQLSGHEWRMVMVIWRQTYGWVKKEDSIALSQFINRTEMPKARCKEALDSLCDRKIIIRGVPENRYSKPRIYKFNKHFHQWKRVPENRYTGKPVPRSTGKPENEYRKTGTTKETIQKKELKKLYVETSDEVRLSELLLSKILENHPNFKKPNIQKWAKIIDLTHRIDKRPFMQLEATIKWLFAENVNSDFPFVVQSPGALRDKFDRIQAQMGRDLTEAERYEREHGLT